ncbi:MAG: hypothetical protein HRU01_20700, partial [Myxococcales bacterium]|nr:hypothetical protein [Myxococcales bacterium]
MRGGAGGSRSTAGGSARVTAAALIGLGLLVTAAAPAAAAEPGEPAGLLSPRRVDAVKAGIAVAGTVLVGLGALRRRRNPSAAPSRAEDAALLSLGLAGALCWWNLLAFHYPGYAHPRDNFHYYLGSKYFPELGYERLYACAAVADAEAGLRGPGSGGRIRDLGSNTLVPARATLDRPARCKGHFSAERWEAFSRDVAFMRGRLPAAKWRTIFSDHGYNATPAWGLIGGVLTNSAPLGRGQLRALTAIDPLLLAAMWGAVVWAFGWRVACIGSIFWGTNYFAGYGWTGGGILRQDWLAATVIGLCLLRREQRFAAGFALGWAALLRVFPGFLLVALALAEGASMLASRRLHVSAPRRRIAAGALLALAIGVPLSGVVMGRSDSAGGTGPGLLVWLDFANNSRIHLTTPLQNHMGLQTLLSFDPDQTARKLRDITQTDAYADWKRARVETLRDRYPLYVLAVIGFAAWLAVVGREREDWVVASLGIGLVPIASELTNYYYAVLLG